jgi:ribosomal protein L20
MLELEEIIALWARRELEKKKERFREMWVRPIICDRRNKGLFWTVLEDLRRDEAKF